jgi:hypothetical protein
MGKPSKEFQAFDSLTKQLLTVPKSTIHERHAEHKRKAALNPRKRGPKPKITPPSATDPDEESGNG